jgi:hypothetical protein
MHCTFYKGFKSVILFLGVAGLVLLSSPAVFADDGSTSGSSESTETPEDHKSATQSSQHKDIGKHGKLSEDRLKLCQSKEKSIDGIMQKIVAQGNNHLDVLNKIADRTQTFATNHNLTVANYQTLVSDMNVKKAAVTAAINAASLAATNFKCDGTDPQGTAASFQAVRKTEIAALKEYKTSVKNLIKAVHAAAEAAGVK